MISTDKFLAAMKAAIGRLPNTGQAKAVKATKAQPLFIVAGPGTGKTATITMRMLKLVFVDGVAPNTILATTFTKKAAEELRSRLLSWGYAIQEELAKLELSKMDRMYLERVDINQLRTGTIDSICEEVLRDFRDPGSDPPILVDEFVSETLLLHKGLFGGGRYKDDKLDKFLCDARGTGKFGWNIGAKNGLLRTMWDRRHHDQLRWKKFSGAGATADEKHAVKKVVDGFADYEQELKDRLMVDFAQLEQTVLTGLKKGGLQAFTDELNVILVDEYQDTNLLQEGLYFEMAKRCNGALVVVGDDDQSMYRFRGATVDLFSDFENRYNKTFGKMPKKIFLNENYRSTTTIIDFVNDYATLDAGYQAARVAGKPKLKNPLPGGTEYPVLGMFRSDPDTLARDLARFIKDVTKGNGFKVGRKTIRVDQTRDKNGHQKGDVGDIAFLCSSPQEFAFGGRERLPRRLRVELASGPKTKRIEVFNPRGQNFSGIQIVKRLGGLLLECLDPNNVQDSCKGLSQQMRDTMNVWRSEAVNWVQGNPKLSALEDFAVKWSDRDPGRAGYKWPKSVSCIDLLYSLIHWMPELHDDPEGQVYLEVFTRQLGAAEQVSGFKTRVVTDPKNQDLSDKSVAHLLQYFLGPIAAGSAKVDEELIDSFPRDRLSVLSIHQSKGLEFPLAIVDVGSDFRSKHHAHAFKRFPRGAGPTQNMEDLMRPHSPLKTLSRSGHDRAFDDLYRQFFVAFSRPQDVLLLVGLDATKPGGRCENIATGWDRDGVNHWESNLPFVEI